MLVGVRRSSRPAAEGHDPFQSRHQDVQGSVAALRDVKWTSRGVSSCSSWARPGQVRRLLAAGHQGRADRRRRDLGGRQRGWYAGALEGAVLAAQYRLHLQDYRLLPERTVYENVAFALEVIGRSRHFVRSTGASDPGLVGLGEKIGATAHTRLSGVEQAHGWPWPAPSSTAL